MIINFLVLLAIIALGAWTANYGMALAEAMRVARARVRAARERVHHFEKRIERDRREANAIDRELMTQEATLSVLREECERANRRLAEAAKKKRRRLIVLADHRNPDDRPWVVTLTNSQIGDVDASHPLAQEWRTGRTYLVWAPGEQEASESAIRRFGVRPGFAVSAVTPAGADVFPPPPQGR